MHLEVILFVMVLGGLIPSRIAANKGYSWETIWIAGSIAFPLTLLYVLALPNRKAGVSHQYKGENLAPGQGGGPDAM